MVLKIMLGLTCTLMIATPDYAIASNMSSPTIPQQSSPDLQQRLEASIKHLHLNKAVR